MELLINRADELRTVEYFDKAGELPNLLSRTPSGGALAVEKARKKAHGYAQAAQSLWAQNKEQFDLGTSLNDPRWRGGGALFLDGLVAAAQRRLLAHLAAVRGNHHALRDLKIYRERHSVGELLRGTYAGP